MTKFLCIGGSRDGEWLTLRQLRKHKREYEPMPIRAPHSCKASAMFQLFKSRELHAADVVLLLLDGYGVGEYERLEREQHG